MAKILIWALVFAAVWLLWQKGSKRGGRSGGGVGDAASRRAARGPAAPGAGAEPMLACARCGLHVPASEALRIGAQAYCSPEHRDAGPAAR